MTGSPAETPSIPEVPAPSGTDDTSPVVDLPTDDVAEEPPRRRHPGKFLLLFLLLFGFLLLLGLASWYLLFRQPIPIPTIPGEVIMPGYVTSIYGPNRPLGVAVTPDGSRIYVGETEGDRIARVFDASGNELGLMQPPVSTGPEHVPVYLAADPLTGEVYVTDRPTGSIFIYDAAGTYQRQFQPAKAFEGGWQPLGIAFDAAGNLYVSDISVTPQVVLVFDRAGNVVRKLGETAGFNFPNGIAVDKDGNVYVTDSSNGRLLVIGPTGAVLAQVGRGVGEGRLGLPRGIAISGDGRVYVGDATSQGVYVYGTLEPDQKRLDYLGFFGGQGVSNGTFQFPNGVAVDARGRVYITDSGNDRVQMWSY